MVFECFWSSENGIFNRKFTLVQHPMSPGPFQYAISELVVKVYLRLTWKCEVGAQLGLKRLIWG